MLSLRGNEAKSHTGEVSTEANYQKYKISKMLLLHKVAVCNATLLNTGSKIESLKPYLPDISC